MSSKLIDNAYANLIVELKRYENQKLENLFPINEKHGVLSVPVSTITNLCEMGGYRYHEISNCYSLLSLTSLEKSGVRQVQGIPAISSGGQGVLIGVIDTGIDYQHKAFRNEDGTSRIVSIWDMTIQTPDRAPSGLDFGTEYTKEQINEALLSENPLSSVPTVDENGHGTMIAGIAAGKEDLSNNFSGVVPNAELVVVKLQQARKFLRDIWVVPEDVICYREVDILLAIKYITSVAKQLKRPISICMALGTNQGGHDGTGSVSSYLSTIANSPGMAAVIAGGNEGSAKRHYFGSLEAQQEFDEFEINVGSGEYGFTMEIWGYTPSRLSVDVITPTGEYIPQVLPSMDECREVNLVFAPTIIQVNNYIVEAETGDQAIIVRLRKPVEGIWKFRVYNLDRMTTSYHVWLPLDGLITNSTFFTRPDADTTIVSPGNAVIPITVGAYNHENDSIYNNSSRGYTRTNNVKPDLVAPGVDLVCPLPNGGYGKTTGTGAAAAHAAGIAAMGLEWGVVKGNDSYINGVEIKKILIRGADRSQNLTYPNRIWGYGTINVLGAFKSLS